MGRIRAIVRRVEGFTLLEVIIAFVIMALIIGATLDTFSTGLRNAVLTGNYAEAIVRAESRLAVLDQSEALVSGVESGRFNETYIWRTVVSRVVPDQDVDAEPTMFWLYNVAVTVSWGQGRDSREVTLQSQRLKRALEL